MSQTQSYTFGDLLKQARKHAGMTQGDLAAAIGYSISFVSALELNRRLPDVESVLQHFVPALGLQDDPKIAIRLVELAAAARGERLPVAITRTRETRIVVTEETLEEVPSLPASPTALIGRGQEVRNLGHRLLGHGGRLLTLVGPPGVGKTRLALAIAEQLQTHFQDGALFVPLAAITDPALLPSTLLSTLKILDESSKPHKIRLIEYLRRKQMLLVLDNFEQLVSSPMAKEGAKTDAGIGLVAELLAECAGLCILVTSRERLHLRAEQRYQVPSLALAAAVELFTQRATAIDPNFTITEPNRPLVEAICQQLDRLPLALELCAGQADLLSLPQLLAGLKAHPLDLLVAGAHDLPPQQRTLRTAIGRSYALLNQDEQKLFRSLGVFVGGFELTALAMVGYVTPEFEEWRLDNDAIPPSVVAALRTLVSKSLVHSEPLLSGEQRFLLLETLREFALEQLRAQGEETEVRQRHYLAYLRLFRTGDSYLRRAEATAWMARLEPEQDNLRAALQWTLDTARYADMAWLIIATNYLWVLNGYRYETARWVARLLPHRQSLALDLRLAIFVDFISSTRDSREYQVEEFREEIIALMEICPGHQLQSAGWHFLAQSSADETRAYMLARAGNEAPTLGPEFGEYADHEFILAATQIAYAYISFYRGEVEEATRLFTDSLQRFRGRGNQSWISDCLGALGQLALLRGELIEAHTNFLGAVTIGTTYNLPMVTAEWQTLLGLATLYIGDATEARRLSEESLRISLKVRHVFYLKRTYRVLAEISLWEGDMEQAVHWLRQSLAHNTVLEHITETELEQLFIAARLATMQGQYLRAATLLGVASAAHRQIHNIYAGPMLPLVNAAQATVQEALNADVFAEAFSMGQQLSLDEAFATLLAPAAVTGRPAAV